MFIYTVASALGGLIAAIIIAVRTKKSSEVVYGSLDKLGLITNIVLAILYASIAPGYLFIGMIAAFLGFVFCDFSSVFSGETYGLVPPLVMAVSALVTLLCGAAMKLTGWRWISDYALPLSLVLAMAAAIPLTAWLGAPPQV